jgi:hypothetical protein
MYIYTLNMIDMKESGKMVLPMVMVVRITLMEVIILVYGGMVGDMVKALLMSFVFDLSFHHFNLFLSGNGCSYKGGWVDGSRSGYGVECISTGNAGTRRCQTYSGKFLLMTH